MGFPPGSAVAADASVTNALINTLYSSGHTGVLRVRRTSNAIYDDSEIISIITRTKQLCSLKNLIEKFAETMLDEAASRAERVPNVNNIAMFN